MSPQAHDALRIMSHWSSDGHPCVAGPWHIARALGDRSQQGYADAATALAELQAAGRIRKIGPSTGAKDRQTAYWEIRP